MTPAMRIALGITASSFLASAEPAPSQTRLAPSPRPQVATLAVQDTDELKGAVEQLGRTRIQMTQKLRDLSALRVSARNRIANAAKIASHPTACTPEALQRLRKELEAASKDVDAEDKLGSFEIQDLMSRYNQAERRASDVVKKLEAARQRAVGKI